MRHLLGFLALCLCGLGIHAKPIGRIEWHQPYKPGSEHISYTNYLGCPRCGEERETRFDWIALSGAGVVAAIIGAFLEFIFTGRIF